MTKKMKIHKPILEGWRDFQSSVQFGVIQKGSAEEIIILLINMTAVKMLLNRQIELANTTDKWVVGGIHIIDPRVAGNGDDIGNCHGAWEVQYSGVGERHQNKGYGKMLYMLAMAALYPTPVMADRLSVSKGAIRLWQSIAKTAELANKTEKPYIGRFDDVDNPQTEPADDDCLLQVNSRRSLGEDTPLNQAYRSNKLSNLHSELVKNGEQINKMFDINQVEQLFHAFFARIA